jgi:Rad3-related DNA helicase
VFFRGKSIEEAIKRAKEEFRRQGPSASMYIIPKDYNDELFLIDDPDFQLWTEEAEEEHNNSFKTWRHNYLCDIIDYMGGTNVERMKLLLSADSEEIYLEKRFQTGKEWALKRSEELSKQMEESLKHL